MRIPSAAVALLLLAPASCKKHDKNFDDPGPPPGSPSTASSETATTPPPPKKAVKKALKPEELGECKLSATGAVTKEQTTMGGKDATNVTYWMTEDERKNLMGTDGFALNCHGPDIKFSLLPSGQKDGQPFKPKKYTFAKGTGDANVMVRFGQISLDAITGTVDVTAFDKDHIAGTIDLQGKLVPGNKPVKLTGSFDLKCPGFGACGE